jgi:cytochrome P450
VTQEAEPLAYPTARTCPFDPPPEYARLRAEPGISRVKIWDGSTPWLVTRYGDARHVLSQLRVSADNRLAGYPAASAAMGLVRDRYRSFITMDPPEHTKYRRMLNDDFSSRRAEEQRPEVEAIVDELLDRMLTKTPPVDFVEEFALALPSTVICLLLGVPYDDHKFFQERATIMGSSRSTREEAERAATELIDGYLGDLVDRRIAEPADDVISRLVVNYYGEVDRDDLKAIARLLLVAGHDTTGNMTALGTLTFLQNPDQLAKLRANPALVPNAVEELLRYLNIAHSGRRRVALEDLDVAGETIREGEGIIVSNPSADRDAAVFERPDEFDIERPNARRHTAFGYGRHTCLGVHLARVELQSVFAQLFERIPTLRLAVPMDELEFDVYGFNYGVESMPVAWGR